MYLSYLEEFNESLFNPKRINDQIKALSPLIRPSYAQESDDVLKEFDYTVGWNGLSDDPLDSAYRMYRKPLRAFVGPRHQSVKDQLEGKSTGLKNLGEGGFNMGNMYMDKFDTDSNSILSHDEFVSGFENWFEKWTISDSTALSNEELIDGLNNDFLPFGPDPKKKKETSQE